MTTTGYGDTTPRRVLGRIVGITWMFAGIIIANFTATITSALTIQDLRGAINGPDDLIGKRIATVRATTSANYLSTLS